MTTTGRPPDTGTRGFLFADLRGYTDYVERHGDDAAAALLDRYRRMVREVVARQQGAEVRTEGDSFYVLFPSASRAVSAALGIVAEAATRLAEDPNAPIKVGVGVHAGETSETDEGPVGSAVNLAARICAQAQAGEVLVSDTVRGLTRTRQVADFIPIGTRRLKGITEPIALFRAVPAGTAARVGAGRARAAAFAGAGSRGPLWRSLLGAAVAITVLGVLGFVALRPLITPGASPSPTGAQSGVPATDPSGTPTQAATPTALVPTGSRIIYSRQQRLGAVCDGGPPDAKLYVLDPDDPEQEPYRLTRYSNLFELDPAWSADGSRLAVVGSIGRGPGGINTMSPAGDTVELLLEGRRTPGIGIFARTGLTIAPNGHAIVHHQDEFMWRTDLGGGGLVQIGGPIPPEVPGPEDPTPTEFFVHVEYRAAGDLLALMRPVGGGPRWLELMAEDGSERQRLEFDLDGLDVVGFALASDDDLIAFVTFDATTETNSLMVGSLGEGRAGLAAVPIALDTVEQPAFSPRGDRLVLEGGSPGAQQLYEVKSESGEVRQLTHEAEFQACSPVWRDAPPDLAQPWPEPIAGESRRFELGLLVPGTYLNDITQPPVALTFTDGWYARRNYADGWSVWRPEGPLGEVDYGRIQFGPDNPCGEGDLLSIGNTPEALLTHLKARDDLSVTEVGPINLSGYPGITASISGIEGQGCGVEGDPAFEYWSLFPTGEDQFSLSTGEGLRLVTLDVGGSARSFLVFAGVDELDAYWDDYARPLLQTATYPTP